MKADPIDLIPPARELYYRFRELVTNENVSIGITCIKRTKEEQIALYAHGRQPLKITNELRRIAGLPSIIEKENKNPITWTLNSRHLPIEADSEWGKAFPEFIGKCLAWDIVIMTGEKKVSWDLKVDVDKDSIPDYEEVAKIGEKLGLIVGARWEGKKRDWPHYEFDIRRYYNEKKN